MGNWGGRLGVLCKSGNEREEELRREDHLFCTLALTTQVPVIFRSSYMQTPASRLVPLAVYPLCLLASSDLIINSIVTSFPDLRLEIHVNQLSVNSLAQSPHSSPSPPNETHLALIRSPLPIRIPIKHHLATPRIFNLYRRMAQSTLRAPLNIIAGGFLDQEGLAAPLVAVRVNALLDCEVQNGA